MKRTLAWILVVALILGAAACAKPATVTPAAEAPAAVPAVAEEPATQPEPEPEPVEPVIMQIGHFGAVGEPVANAADAFAAKVAELSGGIITVDVHGASSLGNSPEMIEQTQLGAIQGCLVSQGTLQAFDARYYFVTAPYLYSGYDQAYALVDGPFAEWVADGKLEESGLHNIGPWDYGFRCLTNSVREVKVPADVAGLLLRTPQEVQKVACFEALGATVQPLAFSELLPALKAGTFDGQENPISTIYNNKMWECNQIYLSLTRHTWEAVNLVVNNDWWNSLTAEQQGWIMEAAAMSRDMMRKEVQEGEASYIQKLKDEGVTVTEVDQALFKAEMTPAYDRISEAAIAGGAAPDAMQTFLAMVDSVG